MKFYLCLKSIKKPRFGKLSETRPYKVRKKSVAPYLLTFLVETIASMVLHRTQLYQVYALASMASGDFFPKNCEVMSNHLWVFLFSFFTEF